MHRTGLGVTAGALALLVAAVGAPASSTHRVDEIVGNHGLSVTLAAASAPVEVVNARKRTRTCSAGLIALTFDDGPSTSVTPGLVRTLRRYKVPATFFMVGSRIHTAPGIARLVQRNGFTIANHTWSHPQLTHLTDGAITRQLRSTRREMRAAGLAPGHLMRPPYGDINRRVNRDIRGLGLVPVLWTIDSLDWSGGSSRQIANRILGALRPHKSNLVLQHDGVNNSPNSVAAVPIVVRQARKRGYCFTHVGPRGGVGRPVPNVRVSTQAGNEAGHASVRFRLDLDKPTDQRVSVLIQTVAGTATPDADFKPRTLRITFPVGEQQAWFAIPVIDDDLAEPTETFTLRLSKPQGLAIPKAEYTAEILSDEAPR